MRKKTFMVITMALALALMLSAPAPSAWASKLVPQTPLPGNAIVKYAEPLPIFSGNRISGTDLTVSYHEFQQKVLPHTAPNDFYAALTAPYNAGTYVWGYKVDNGLGGVFGPNFPATTILAERLAATTVHYDNTLPLAPILQRYITIDQTLHWANPLGLAMGDPARMAPYQGPQPVVPHLHGAEVTSAYDGGPDQWFTPNGIQGPGYRTAVLADVGTSKATYIYPNTQEATTLWYHEHTLGATRTNVYAGLAGYYWLRDATSFDTGVAAANGLPTGDREVEFVIQDRMFDTNGQLFFPDVGINPEHPFWLPEFLGDVIVVNGATWPKFNVLAQRYRVRFLNGSNARFYDLSISQGKGKGKKSLPIYVIGNDGGLLDVPFAVNNLVFGPGERYDAIIDFSAAAGQTLVMTNVAKAPFPNGTVPDPQTVGQIVQIVVGNPPGGGDNTFDPAAANAALRGGGKGPNIVRLAAVDANFIPTGALVGAVTVDRYRQLTLNEVMGPGGPLEVLVNNTKWSGERPDHTVNAGFSGLTINPNAAMADQVTNYLSELPQVGSTEVWEIINLTADAHPIHLHLVQFQILNRQNFNVTQYTKVYNAAFGGVFSPAFGPPYNYDNSDNPDVFANPTLGGNPDVTPFLKGALMPPASYESGWKDTAIMYPGQVTRIVVRWTPTDITVAGELGPGNNQYPFDPTTANQTYYDNTGNQTYGPGYVWHCHIIDHEDNEMMRPYIPVNNANNLTD